MNDDKNDRRGNEKRTSPTTPDRKEINPASRSWEPSRNPESDNDRKGRNIDKDLENQKNEISGREQQTTPKSKAKDIAEGFSSREQQQENSSKKND